MSAPFQLWNHFSRECDQPDNKLTCPICLMVLHEPIMHASCRNVFCLQCVANEQRCPMCRMRRPEYTSVPVYMTDQLREIPNVSCLICKMVVNISKAQPHYNKDCVRLIKPLMDVCQPSSTPLLEGEVCIGAVSNPHYLKLFATNHGRLYTAEKDEIPPLPIPLAPGLQWILQQLCQTFLSEQDLRSIVQVLNKVEDHRPRDFGLKNEEALTGQIMDLKSQVNDLLDQRSALRTEASENDRTCTSLMQQLGEANDMIAQMQEFHGSSEGEDKSRKRHRKRHRSSRHRSERSEGDEGEEPVPPPPSAAWSYYQSTNFNQPPLLPSLPPLPDSFLMRTDSLLSVPEDVDSP